MINAAPLWLYSDCKASLSYQHPAAPPRTTLPSPSHPEKQLDGLTHG